MNSHFTFVVVCVGALLLLTSMESSLKFADIDFIGIFCLHNRITTGNDNALFHFVHVEVGEAILMAPTNIQCFGHTIPAFRKACLLIHNVLQNTVR